MALFKKVTIIGVGLIGGSIGMAIRKSHLAEEVVGVFKESRIKDKSRPCMQGRDKGLRLKIKQAVRLGAIDSGTQDLRKGAEDADLVIVATPVGRMYSIIRRVVKSIKRGCILTDVGSTKQELISKIESFLPDGVYFVGSHPMAGSEKKGLENARPEIFKDSRCVLIKTPHTNLQALDILEQFWARFCDKVLVMDPEGHDQIVSRVSHLPHLVACCLVNSIRQKDLCLASGGFKDTTRIASSDPLMWRDICLTNRDKILDAIDNFEVNLLYLKSLVSAKDGARLMREFNRSKKIRDDYSN